ncbi:MAG: hypothetical protein JNM84_20930 [Planctomycetes bacterium]|nr:hypothetical protein [Planctomycetota bacterium]
MLLFASTEPRGACARLFVLGRLLSNALGASAALLGASACSTGTPPRPSRGADLLAPEYEFASPRRVADSAHAETAPPQEVPLAASAPVAPPADEEWRFELRPYLWVPEAEGKVARGAGASDLGSSASSGPVDTFVNTLVIHGEAKVGPISIFGELDFLRLERDVSSSAGELEIEFSQTIVEIGQAYELVREDLGSLGTLGVEPLGGVRAHFLRAQVRERSSGDRRSGTESWADLFLGARFRAGATDGLGLIGRFDAGAGGADATWNAAAGIDWPFSSFASLNAGYRWLSIDYDSGTGSQRLVYDVLFAGPFFGLSFRF